MISITPPYAAALALLLVVLSLRVIAYRRGHGVSLGDAGDRALLRRMRAQANCAEYAPLGVVLLICLEWQGLAPLALHGLGAMLLTGRLAHAVGFSARPSIPALRVAGTALTLLQLTLSAMIALGLALSGTP